MIEHLTLLLENFCTTGCTNLRLHVWALELTKSGSLGTSSSWEPLNTALRLSAAGPSAQMLT